MNLSRSNYQSHFYFILILAIQYLVSIIFIGEVVLEPHDNLDNAVVHDHVISEIYKGNIEKVGLFLAGEIKWYYLEKLFYPINILHYFLNDKFFYFSNDIIKKIVPYFSFYLLAKSLGVSRFNSSLGGILYSSLIYIKMPVGLGMAFLPYILYLLLNKYELKKKHYFFLVLIGLNSSLIQDIFSFILLIPLSFLLKSENKSFKVHKQIFSVVLFSSILSNIHLVIGSILSGPIHREFWNIKDKLANPFTEVIREFFLNSNINDPLLIFYIPLACLSLTILILPAFSRFKKIKLLIFFIITILILKSVLHHNIIDYFLIGFLDILKGFNFQRVDRIIPIAYSLLFVLYLGYLKSANVKKIFYFISLLSIICIQLKMPLPIITQYLLKKNMNEEKFINAKEVLLEKKYFKFIKIIANQKNYLKKEENYIVRIEKTFDGYYKFKEYAFIKNIVKESRVMSVGYDPMIAVMNDIKVIDGYHNIYPYSYKIKFRKVIERELEKNVSLKNYYDNWGSRVYAFYTNENNIELNFQSAKDLGADYIISKFPIENNELEMICFRCNKSNHIFLYKII